MKKEMQVNSRLNFPVLIFFVLILFTVLLWNQYLNSEDSYGPIFISNLILIMGILFSISSSLFVWNQERLVAQLRDQKIFMDNILNSMKDSLIILDKNQRIDRANTASLKLLGCEDSEIIGKPFSSIVDNQDSNGFAGKECGQYQETKYKTFQDNWVDVSLSFEQITNGRATNSGFVCIAQDITSRKQQEQQIKKSLQEKMDLIDEVHDRVKNNLQVINSLIRMQVKQYYKEEDSEFFEGIQRRIQSVALVHEILYQSKDLSHISTKVYLRKLISSILQADQRAQPEIIFNAEDVLLDITKAIPYGLIAYELLAIFLSQNFSEQNKGTVHIKFYKNANNGTLEIREDRVGISRKEENLEANSFEMKVVKILARQLQGTVNVNGSKVKEISVHFPLSIPMVMQND